MEPRKEIVSSITPAPGWRILCCSIRRNGEINLHEWPVIGWAVERIFSDDGQRDEIQLFAFVDGNLAVSVDQARADHFNLLVIAPSDSTELVEARKADLVRWVKARKAA